MENVKETRLPGVGVRHDFDTQDGRRVGVITHNGGRRDLLVYSQRDPDACAQTIHLGEAEAHTLADVLGGSRVTRSVTDVVTVDGVTIDWLRVSDDWPTAGRTLREVRLPEKVGVVVVAVIRAGETNPSPLADLELHGDDTVVVVGTTEAVAAAGKLLRGE